ncbi:hypothetical protein ACFX13_009224 [Malus domestica]
MAVKNLKLRNTYAGPKQESRNLGDSLGSRSCSWSVNRHRCFILIPPNSQLFILHAGFLGDRNKFGVGDEAIKCNMEVLPLFSPLDEADIDLRVYRNYSVGLLPEAAFRSPVLLADSPSHSNFSKIKLLKEE